VNAQPDAIKTIHQQFLDDYSYARMAREFVLRGDFDRAADACRQALKLNPKSATALCYLGIVLMEQGMLEEAEPHLTRAVRYEPGHKVHQFNLGSVLSRQGRRREAEAHYRRALQINPEYFKAHLAFGVDLLDAGRLPEAVEQLVEAARLTGGPEGPLS
jgi:tetratricopeptide (TPR) repeat protein